jgi:uncharacterized RDD family membrane protein YckC
LGQFSGGSAGGLSVVPLNIAVLGVAAVILIFAYFAVFTAIASATPGLLWMGCEIRNLHGGIPTVRESFWRAFGVLVSLSALMLGFIWACVDSDGLTWHDRMSGTVITEEHIASDLAGLNADILARTLRRTLIFVAASRDDFSMGKGKFVNQKLGKNVSRKFDLLKSELAGRQPRVIFPPIEPPLPKKGISRDKP